MRSLTSLFAIAVSVAAAACGGNTSPLQQSHANAPASRAPLSSELVARFDASAGELPEGLVVTSDTAYVGFAPTSQVVSIDASSGTVTPYGQLPPPASGKGFMTGLAQSHTGQLYAGLASFVPEVQAGIYRIPEGGGAAVLFARDAALSFPNALAFDGDDTLWVTDSGTGSVFHIGPNGSAERWVSGDVLSGDKDACGGLGPGFAIGSNGLIVESDAVYVVNNDKATLIQIPRDVTGRAGVPIVLAGPDCDTLGGADGLTRAPDGSFVIADNRQNKLVRVTADGAVETLASGALFDFPATVVYRGDTLYATNFAFQNAGAGKPAAPSLIRITQ